MPALEALLSRFDAAHNQPVGISVDSVYSHANWAAGMGGISFPLLADFHPKGATAQAYGLYLEEKGITDRATVIVDADGIVRHASSVTPAGERDIGELAALCERVDTAYAGDLSPAAQPDGLNGDLKLFVKSNCGFSRAVLLARENLKLKDRVPVVNVTEDAAAMAELRAAAGKEQAPCLVADGKAMLESSEIIRHLVTGSTGLWA